MTDHSGIIERHSDRLSDLTNSTKSAHKRLDGHDTSIEKIGCRVQTLEQDSVASRGRIDSLCEKLDGLIVTLRWGIGVITVAMLGFGAWMLQQMLLR